MDAVQEMIEGLATNESSFHEYFDLTYEFDAYQFYDFSVDETDYEVEEAESWFRYARGYPPAPYMYKIMLTGLLKSAPAKVHSIPEADEHVTSSPITPSDFSISSPEKKTDQEPSRTFMKPTASHLAKQINSVDVNEATKRQKLEIGFLSKKPNSRETTIPREPELMVEIERARRRSFRSRSTPEANMYTFKAVPLNRKVRIKFTINYINLRSSFVLEMNLTK